MKRSLAIIFPIVILIAIGACDLGTGALPKYSPEQWTAIANTQAVMGQTKEDRIRNWLNRSKTDFNKFDLLEQGLIGTYEVVSVVFPTDYYFEVDMNCECASGSNCCEPKRMFFLTLQKMVRSRDQILAEVPATVQYLEVVCQDHKMPFYAIYAPWDKVKDFLLRDTPTPTDINSLIATISQRPLP